jgi:predicted metal-dependent hydrolase
MQRGLLRGLFDWFTVEPSAATASTPFAKTLTIVLAGNSVRYELHRAKRRSVSMAIVRSGLVVRAPMRIAQREIESILQGRAEWIVQKLQEWHSRTTHVAARYGNGGSVLYRGKRLGLRVVPSLFDAFEATETELLIASTKPLTREAQQHCVECWMRARAQEQFAPQVLAMAQHIGVDVKVVKLTDTRTMWGSCTSDGVIRLTFRLIQLPSALADYVIAHEVAHRRELNHSPRFWEWVRMLDPHFKSHRRTLTKYTPLLEE